MGENIENALMGLLAEIGIGILRKEFLDLVLVRELNLAEPAYKKKVERRKNVTETKSVSVGGVDERQRKDDSGSQVFFLRFAVFLPLVSKSVFNRPGSSLKASLTSMTFPDKGA